MRIVMATLFAITVAATPAVGDVPIYPHENEEVLVEVDGARARLLACFEEVLMPAKVLVEPILIEPKKRQYVKRRNGTIELVEYPAVYVEERTVLEPEYIEYRQIPCKAKRKSFLDFLTN